MPIAEWENLAKLITPQGELVLNDVGDENPNRPVYLTVKDGADSGTEVRSTGDPVPQGFGTLWHRGFANGYVLKIPIQYWITGGPGNNLVPASEQTTPTAQEMDDLLMLHYRSLMDGGGRILYSPAQLTQRIADRLFAIAKPTLVEEQANTNTVLEFGSEFPYLLDFTQTLTQLSDGSPSATLTNTGSAPMQPVFKVYGPFDQFVLTNSTTGEAFIYDDSLPGAVAIPSGHYIEITTFQDSVYLDGDGPSRKAGIDIRNSDFWALEPGDNDVIVTANSTAPDVDILWQAAWF
jgi:hypothetical protein